MRYERHGLSKTRLYGIFHNMKQRCYNPNDPKYGSYGGKGIAICQEWLDDFMNFYNWAMQNGYSDELTIDRKESNKGYSPDNCRWVTMEENRDGAKSHGKPNKTPNNKIEEIRALTGLTQKQFAEKYHITFSSIRNWESGHRTCPDYVVELLEFKVKEDLKMKKTYELILERLNAKKNELKERQDQFDVMWCNERNSSCFERNAINDLLIMQQLKSEIAELEHWETLMRVQIEK